ncbi:DUF6894 family protein [Metarhizobium album]|nr:hypothetical protein [Rhizobium album]
MGRFFFDISNGDGDSTDDDGVEFPTAAAAEDELAKVLGDVVREAVVRERNGRVVVRVRDESGNVCMKGMLDFAIENLPTS